MAIHDIDEIETPVLDRSEVLSRSETAYCRFDSPSFNSARAHNWINGQIRILEAWISDLVAEDGEVMLIATLDQHLAFLKQARGTMMLSKLEAGDLLD